MDFYIGDRVVYAAPFQAAGPRQNDAGTVIQAGSCGCIKVQFDRRFKAPLGGGIWWCGAGNLRHVDAVELQPPTISLEGVL